MPKVTLNSFRLKGKCIWKANRTVGRRDCAPGTAGNGSSIRHPWVLVSFLLRQSGFPYGRKHPHDEF